MSDPEPDPEPPPLTAQETSSSSSSSEESLDGELVYQQINTEFFCTLHRPSNPVVILVTRKLIKAINTKVYCILELLYLQ